MTDQTVLPVPPPPTTEQRIEPLTIAAIASLGAGAIHARGHRSTRRSSGRRPRVRRRCVVPDGYGRGRPRSPRPASRARRCRRQRPSRGWVDPRQVEGHQLHQRARRGRADPVRRCVLCCSCCPLPGRGGCVLRRLHGSADGEARVRHRSGRRAGPGRFARNGGCGEPQAHGETRTIIRVNGKTKTVTAAVVPPQPYDPKKPINLEWREGRDAGRAGPSGEPDRRDRPAAAEVVEREVRRGSWIQDHRRRSHGTEHFINYSYVKDKRSSIPTTPSRSCSTSTAGPTSGRWCRPCTC